VGAGECCSSGKSKNFYLSEIICNHILKNGGPGECDDILIILTSCNPDNPQITQQTSERMIIRNILASRAKMRWNNLRQEIKSDIGWRGIQKESISLCNNCRVVDERGKLYQKKESDRCEEQLAKMSNTFLPVPHGAVFLSRQWSKYIMDKLKLLVPSNMMESFVDTWIGREGEGLKSLLHEVEIGREEFINNLSLNYENYRAISKKLEALGRGRGALSKRKSGNRARGRRIRKRKKDARNKTMSKTLRRKTFRRKRRKTFRSKRKSRSKRNSRSKMRNSRGRKEK